MVPQQRSEDDKGSWRELSFSVGTLTEQVDQTLFQQSNVPTSYTRFTASYLSQHKSLENLRNECT